MSTWINKKFLSISEKVIENVIDSFTNKNTHLENIQNIQETQLGKIISKVISSKYFFKNDDICYNAKELEFKWEVKRKRKKIRIKKKKERKKEINKNNDTIEKEDLSNFNNVYNYIYNNNENEISKTHLTIDKTHHSNPPSLDKDSHMDVSYTNKCDENTKSLNSQSENNNTCNQNLSVYYQYKIKEFEKKKNETISDSNPNISNDGKNKAFHETSNLESNHFGKMDDWKGDSEMDSENSSDESESSTSVDFLECLSINKYESYNSNSSNLGTSPYVSSKNDGGVSSELSKIHSQSFTSNIFNDDQKNYIISKPSNLCKMNIFIKEAKLLFYNKTKNINNLSIYCTTIIEKKKYVGQPRRLSFKTLPINNLIINEYINHGVKDIYSDIIINIKYKNNGKNKSKNKKNGKEDITIGRIIIPLFLLLNTYRCKIKKIKNKMRYCTKCFLWLHIFPCNNKLFNYKFFKPVQGFEEYGMINPMSTLGFLNIKIKIVFKKNPLLLTLYSNIRKPLFYYKLPQQFEPLYCQYYTENFFVYINNLPLWIYKFFYIFNPNCVYKIQLNYYDYIFVLLFWLFFFRLIVFSPFFHIFIYIFFCMLFISLSYKYGHTQNREQNYSRYNFKPINIKDRNKRNVTEEKTNLSFIQESKNIHFYDKKVGGVLASMNDLDFDYCKCPEISETPDVLNAPCLDPPSSLPGSADQSDENVLGCGSDQNYAVTNDIKQKENSIAENSDNDEANNSSLSMTNLSSGFNKSTMSPPKAAGISIEENCFEKESAIMDSNKNKHNFESDLKCDKLEIDENEGVDSKKRMSNVANFAKKIQNMVIDGTKTNTINMNNWNANMNKFINLFTKKDDTSNVETVKSEDENSEYGDKVNEKYKQNIFVLNKNKDNVSDKKNIYLLYDSGSNAPNKYAINSSRNSKHDEHDGYQVEINSDMNNTSDCGYFVNNELNENNKEICKKREDPLSDHGRKLMNKNDFEKSLKIKDDYEKNYATPLFDTSDNPFMSSNNLLESRFLKRNSLLDLFKNNNENTETDNKNESDLKKKSEIRQIVKSPFHNFHLFIKSAGNKDVSIFSNNIGVPNIQLLLSRFIILITCAQIFTGIFTMIYEKTNYALNWDFNFYTINNIIILFILCYSISFVLYILSFVPFSIYRFIFFITISILIIKSYELTEEGQRARLYLKNKKKNKKKYLNMFKKVVAKTIIHILKGRQKNCVEWILSLCKMIYSFIFNSIMYTKFIMFFLKNWVTRLLILKDIEHIKIARLQAFKNLYFFIHNRMIDRQNLLITEGSNNIKNIVNGQYSNNSNQTKGVENHKKNTEDENEGGQKDNILSNIIGNKRNSKNILRNPMYENYKNIDLCIYSSSENDNNSVASQCINEYNKNNNLENFKDEMNLENDDNISISQMTDNGNMNINVDIFLHYYFKKKKQDIFNNFININRNYINIYKDINLLNNTEEHKINNLYYADYFNDEHNYSSSYDNNKRTKRF
ncbi:conserved Plasmodium protein, unknown function [Plasmodium chabaudi chabaudi]|uniref:Uncharacterized protein n=1 Tax=Plasmodium chabaudi chabaudi TaxID=31271 RepID=A0A4V0K4S5_PLACU|nr:conserved Plasmodium protein, unknown function [Plasmodium chabaudi chabaudi]VTZ67949.1 conserved Plasmodium protein, unknown function [Plasmodium chabaudi chabaudi]|eukprot:XP_016653559.1 conserved Plasmodium protein, unknown function [Plasmodium chabaudi chabaudi]